MVKKISIANFHGAAAMEAAMSLVVEWGEDNVNKTVELLLQDLPAEKGKQDVAQEATVGTVLSQDATVGSVLAQEATTLPDQVDAVKFVACILKECNWMVLSFLNVCAHE